MNGAVDMNSRTTVTARLNTDGVSILRITADSSTGAMSTTATTAGSIVPKRYAATDDNDRPTMFAVSEVDGVTPVALQCDASGELLIKVI